MFYYFGNILDDNTDDKSRAILWHIVDVMTDDSVILVDDVVIPDTEPYWQATQMDVIMMSMLAWLERTREQ